MKRGPEDAKNTNENVIPHIDYIKLGKDALAAGQHQQASQYFIRAQAELNTLIAGLNSIQHSTPTQNNAQAQQHTSSSSSTSSITVSNNNSFQEQLKSIIDDLSKTLLKEEYKALYSIKQDKYLAQEPSLPIIQFLKDKNTEQLKSVFDQLCNVYNSNRGSLLTYNTHGPKFRKNHYIVMHLLWASYFHLVQELFNSNNTEIDESIAKLNKIFCNQITELHDFQYKTSYFELMKNYLTNDKFNVTHPIIFHQACSEQDLFRFNILKYCKYISYKNMCEERKTIYKVSNLHYQLEFAEVIACKFEDAKIHFKYPTAVSLASVLKDNNDSDLTSLSLRAMYAIICAETSNTIKATVADIHNFTDCLNTDNPIKALYLDAMARIALQINNTEDAKQYAMQAVALCTKHKIRFDPSYKLYDIAKVRIPFMRATASTSISSAQPTQEPQPTPPAAITQPQPVVNIPIALTQRTWVDMECSKLNGEDFDPDQFFL